MNTFLTYLLTVLLPAVGGGNSIIRSRIEKGHFFSKQYTDVFKGLCSLVVIYVHVSPERGNMLQDVIGSFAYVAVTFFFLVSAYGMLAGVEKKKDYLNNFWRNRLVSLLIPCLLINIVGYGLTWLGKGMPDLDILYRIDGYVLALLQWCVWFYIVEFCRKKWFAENKFLADFLLVAGVVLSSLCLYLFVDAKVSAEAGWPFERMGLVWGVLLYRYFDDISRWMEQKKAAKVAVLMLLSAILGIGYLKFKMVYFWGAYLMKIVLGFVLLLLLFTVTSNRRFGDSVSYWLGRISYEVYLSHRIVLGFMALMLPVDFNSGAFLLIAVLTTLILSTGVHTISKPIVRALRA